MAGEGSQKDQERLVGRSGSGAAVEVAEEEQVSGEWRAGSFLPLLPQR